MMLATKQVFWNAMLSLFNNYEEFFKYDKMEVEKSFNSSDIFDFSGYLTIFPTSEFPFMEEVSTKTMVGFLNLQLISILKLLRCFRNFWKILIKSLIRSIF